VIDDDGEPDAKTAQSPSLAAPSELDWRTLLVGEETRARAAQPRAVPAIPGELLYVVEVDKTRRTGELTIALRARTPKKSGGSSKDRSASVPMSALESLPDERDIRKACGRAREVSVLAYGGRAVDLWWQGAQDTLAQRRGLEVRVVPLDASRALALLAARMMKLQVTIQDAHIYVTDGAASVHIALRTLKTLADAG